ncbi:MAG: hypothetical protein AAF266_12695 [Planctomycetota bacterium]
MATALAIAYGPVASAQTTTVVGNMFRNMTVNSSDNRAEAEFVIVQTPPSCDLTVSPTQCFGSTTTTFAFESLRPTSLPILAPPLSDPDRPAETGFIEAGFDEVLDDVSELTLAYGVESYLLNGSAEWYLLEEGEAFTRQGVAEKRYPTLVSFVGGDTTNSFQISKEIESFDLQERDALSEATLGVQFNLLLGVAATSNFGGFPQPDAVADVFGWLRLEVSLALQVVEFIPGVLTSYRLDAPALSVEESFSAFYTTGVIAGENRVVPEPPAFGLFFFAAIMTCGWGPRVSRPELIENHA